MMKNRTFDLTILSLLFLGLLFIFISMAPSSLKTLFSCHKHQYHSSAMMIVHRDELDTVLAETSMENKSLIIAMVNKAYVEGDRLETDGVDFDGEKIYMSNDFIKMMWRRTLFLGDVLKRGYNFIYTVRTCMLRAFCAASESVVEAFVAAVGLLEVSWWSCYWCRLAVEEFVVAVRPDIDVLWFRNPFFILSSNEKIDFQISTDRFRGPKSNRINTGFYMIRSNNKTISLFDNWYAKKDDSVRMKEQDVLEMLMNNGLFGDLGLNVRFLHTLYFSGFCQNSRDVGVVVTVHANCCFTISAKVADLTVVIHDWKRAKGLSANETSTFQWSKHVACRNSLKKFNKTSA
ncbi:hypothetical protein C3L33_03009, partial [Rhododendron williamsianum]